jgi:hypothetical protein
MPELQEVFRMTTQKIRPEPGFIDRQHEHRRRQQRRRKIGALSVAAAIAAVASVLVISSVADERQSKPLGPAEDPPPAGSVQELGPPGRVRGAPPAGVPKVDYVIDLNTDVMTPLPKTIIRTLGDPAEDGWPAWLPSCSGSLCAESLYVTSPVGSLLAYVGTGDEGTPQIFIAGIDGTGVRQVTHDPTGATWPAWSPDGTMIAYARTGTEGSTGLFVLDVATGESIEVTDETPIWGGLQFTPDGASLLYSGQVSPVDCSSGCVELRTVPIAGGRSTLLIGREGLSPGELGAAFNGSFSPDGSLVTFQGPSYGRDVERWVANADGTGRRRLAACYDSIPGGTWSPDGGRITCNESVPPTYATILVVNVGTGDARRVARGVAATWLDDHTLLVEV